MTNFIRLFLVLALALSASAQDYSFPHYVRLVPSFTINNSAGISTLTVQAGSSQSSNDLVAWKSSGGTQIGSIGSTGGVFAPSFGKFGSGNLDFAQGNSTAQITWTNTGGERMRLTNNGNLLVGTTTDYGAKFVVAGRMSSTSATGVPSSGTHAIMQYDTSSATADFFGFNYDSTATRPITLNRFGNNVLIGTTTDTGSGAKLQISASGIQLGGVTQPTCDSTHAGYLHYSGHTTNVKDTVSICASDSSNVFSWRSLY